MGWYFGFKLHLIINDRDELLAVALMPGNTDDRKPVPDMTKDLVGKLFGDRGYISQALFETLFERGLSADYQTPQKHEKFPPAAARQDPAAQASDYRNGQ